MKKPFFRMEESFGRIDILIAAENPNGYGLSCSDVYSDDLIDIKVSSKGSYIIESKIFHITIFKGTSFCEKVDALIQSKKYSKVWDYIIGYVFSLMSPKQIKQILDINYQNGYKDGHNDHVKRTRNILEYK